jgi:predicted transcriptional regulator of viral defense system
VVTALEAWGFVVDSPRPAKAVADAMAYEVGRGWLRRVGRGRYRVGEISRGSQYRILSDFR